MAVAKESRGSARSAPALVVHAGPITPARVREAAQPPGRSAGGWVEVSIIN